MPVDRDIVENVYAIAPFGQTIGTKRRAGGAAPSLLDANRHLRDVLEAKGYTVNYFEVPNGQHSPDTWRTRLPVGIVTLAPATVPQ